MQCLINIINKYYDIKQEQELIDVTKFNKELIKELTEKNKELIIDNKELIEFNKELTELNKEFTELNKELTEKNKKLNEIETRYEIQSKYHSAELLSQINNFDKIKNNLTKKIEENEKKNKELINKIREKNKKLNEIETRYEIQSKYHSAELLSQINNFDKIKNNLTKKIEENEKKNKELINKIREKNIELINIKEKYENQSNINSILDNDEEFKKLCIICYENKINYTIIPCGHTFSCEKCIVKINKCSICRIGILNKHKIFI